MLYGISERHELALLAYCALPRSLLFLCSWIDVETNPSRGCGWGSNLAQNCAYIGQLLDAVKSHGIKPGVYAR